MTRGRALVAGALLAVAVAATGCASGGDDKTTKQVKEVAGTVLTLQTGTITEIKDLRGTGPFREYEVPPDEMVAIIASVLKTKVPAVFPEPAKGVVIAKERKGKDAASDDYAPEFRSAVAVFVHPVPDRPNRSRVEMHAVERGPFHRGTIDWENVVPPLLDAAVARRGQTPIRPLK